MLPSLLPTRKRSRWAWHVYALHRLASVKKLPYFRYAWNFSGWPKPLYSGLWPKFQKVKGQHCGTPKHAMENDCFRNACNIGAVYEKAKGYCRAEYNTPEVSANTEVKTTRKSGLCYRCVGSLFQSDCTNLKERNINKFKNKTTAQQNYKGNNYTNKFHDNRNKSNTFTTAILSFQASQQIR